jgi:putative transposase
LYPNKKQEACLLQSLSLTQEMYNLLLEKAIDVYETEGRRFTKFDMCKHVKMIKDQDHRFYSAYSQVLQNCADRLSKAFDNFFRRVKENKEGKRQKPGFPRFKKSIKSITYPQDGFKPLGDGKTISITKIGDVRIRIHRPIVGQVKTMTVVRRRTGKWFVIFSCIAEDCETEPLDRAPEIGLDVGIRHFITTSDGEHIENLVISDYQRRKLGRLQRRIDRKPMGSQNREKARITFAKAMAWEANRRHDLLHKISRDIVNGYELIAVESLDIKQMIMVSPCPDDINKSAWGSLIRMMEYKAESAGTHVISVDRYDPTSQICSGCKEMGKIGKGETLYHCDRCGLSLDRDINAAKNILRIAKTRAGLARSDAWGEGASTSRIYEMRVSSLNQEPEEGTSVPAMPSIRCTGCHSHSTVGHSHSTVAGGLFVIS